MVKAIRIHGTGGPEVMVLEGAGVVEAVGAGVDLAPLDLQTLANKGSLYMTRPTMLTYTMTTQELQPVLQRPLCAYPRRARCGLRSTSATPWRMCSGPTGTWRGERLPVRRSCCHDRTAMRSGPWCCRARPCAWSPCARSTPMACTTVAATRRTGPICPAACFVDLADTRQWIEEALAAPDHLAFAIVETGKDRVVGSTRYLTIRPEHRSLEIGWTWLGPGVAALGDQYRGEAAVAGARVRGARVRAGGVQDRCAQRALPAGAAADRRHAGGRPAQPHDRTGRLRARFRLLQCYRGGMAGRKGSPASAHGSRPATAQLTVACTVSFSEKLSANSAEVR